MSASSIASSVSLRKSRSFTSGSPRASRWALSAIRRHLATVTPGIATGYWNAMNRPASARSSGGASVMSSPPKRIWPDVTSKAGWPMIAFASVDLPDPFGPIRAWISPAGTRRSSPFRISLPSALTCRSRISRSGIYISVFVSSGGRCTLARDRNLARDGAALAGELDEVGERGARERLRHAAMDARPQKLRRTGAVVELVRAQHPALPLDVEALHGREGALERLNHLEHRDLACRPREAVAAVGAADRADQAGLAEPRHQVLEVGGRKHRGALHGGERHRSGLAGLVRVRAAAELDHEPHAVLRL